MLYTIAQFLILLLLFFFVFLKWKCTYSYWYNQPINKVYPFHYQGKNSQSLIIENNHQLLSFLNNQYLIDLKSKNSPYYRIQLVNFTFLQNNPTIANYYLTRYIQFLNQYYFLSSKKELQFDYSQTNIIPTNTTQIILLIHCTTNKIIGCIRCRLGKLIHLQNQNNHPYPSSYIDYFCIHPSYRKQQDKLFMVRAILLSKVSQLYLEQNILPIGLFFTTKPLPLLIYHTILEKYSYSFLDISHLSNHNYSFIHLIKQNYTTYQSNILPSQINKSFHKKNNSYYYWEEKDGNDTNETNETNDFNYYVYSYQLFDEFYWFAYKRIPLFKKNYYELFFSSTYFQKKVTISINDLFILLFEQNQNQSIELVINNIYLPIIMDLNNNNNNNNLIKKTIFSKEYVYWYNINISHFSNDNIQLANLYGNISTY